MNRFLSTFWALVAGAALALAAWSWWGPTSSASPTKIGQNPNLFSDGEVKAPSEKPEAAGSGKVWTIDTSGTSGISDEVRNELDGRVVALAPTIRAAAEHFRVPTDLLAVTLNRESKGDLTAVGDDGDSYGAGQVKEGAQNTVNDYWNASLDRTNWVHNIYLAAGYLRYLYETMWTGGFRLGLGRPTNMWFHATRGYMCGKQGAEKWKECAKEEAEVRVNIAGIQK